MDDLKIYTGTLAYKNIQFTFVFDGNELRLIPFSDDQSQFERSILYKELGHGVYTLASPIIEQPYLIGKCNETGRTIIFFMHEGVRFGSYNTILSTHVVAYILCNSGTHPISEMSFTCPELDCIHPVTQGFVCTLKQEQFQEQGILSVQTEDYDATTTEERHFQLDGVDVRVSFGISRMIGMKIGDPPLRLHSTMVFHFAPTEDYSFILRLWYMAKGFLQFLCYRRDVFIPTANLSTPATEGKTRSFATFNMIGESGEKDVEALKDGRYVKLSYLSGSEGRILNDIAENRLYTRHIPDTRISGSIINAARFIMITAAFEWEFRRLYPAGITKSAETLAIEATAQKELQKLIDNSTGALKQKYKFLRKLIPSNSLQSEIIHIGNHLGSLLEPFGKRLYSMNKAELVYSEMGNRLESRRNKYAHGDLDIDFKDNALLDLIYTERIVYAMQLSFYGIEERNIQKAVNDLFHCGLYIK